MTVTPAQRKFILHWGEMGARWGINRTMAQIHALLYVSEKPLHAEDIAEALEVARSNVSTSLRELQGWGIIRIIHVMGDRRDHFESMKDVWEMFQTILDERKRREIDPTLVLLRECIAHAESGGRGDVSGRADERHSGADRPAAGERHAGGRVETRGEAGNADRYTRDRLRELLAFFETMSDWYARVRQLPAGAVVKFVRMGDKLRKWLGVA